MTAEAMDEKLDESPGDADVRFSGLDDGRSELLLVTAEDCHFCEHAQALLAQLGVEVREVAVDSIEAAALATSGIPLAFLPVLTDGERPIAYGRFSEKHVRRELEL